MLSHSGAGKAERAARFTGVGGFFFFLWWLFTLNKGRNRIDDLSRSAARGRARARARRARGARAASETHRHAIAATTAADPSVSPQDDTTEEFKTKISNERREIYEGLASRAAKLLRAAAYCARAPVALAWDARCDPV